MLKSFQLNPIPEARVPLWNIPILKNNFFFNIASKPAENSIGIFPKTNSESIDLSKDNIEKRLKRFKKEMAFKDRFDTLLINDNIEVAKNEFLKKLNEIIEGA